MSMFIVGLIQLNISTSDERINRYSKLLSQLALDYDYSLKVGYFHNPYYRNIFERLYKDYKVNFENSIEFELADSPVSGSFDNSLIYFQDECQQQRIYCNGLPYNSKFFKFLIQLWKMEFITEMIFVFSYGLYDYDELNHTEASMDEMLKDIWTYYCNGTIDQYSCYIIRK